MFIFVKFQVFAEYDPVENLYSTVGKKATKIC